MNGHWNGGCIGTALALAGVAILAGAVVAGEKAAVAKGADAHFVQDALQGGSTEVQLGKLAVAKASSDRVKQFGQRMIDDHSRAADELKSVASQKGMTVPAGLGAKNQGDIDRLSKLSGEAFDRAYMKHMVLDHRKDVAEFKKESSGGQDPDVKAFAGKTLPTLQEHLKMAQDISAALAGGKGKMESADRKKR